MCLGTSLVMQPEWLTAGLLAASCLNLLLLW